MYVGGVELLRNLSLCGGGSNCCINEIKRAGETFVPDNQLVMGVSSSYTRQILPKCFASDEFELYFKTIIKLAHEHNTQRAMGEDYP